MILLFTLRGKWKNRIGKWQNTFFLGNFLRVNEKIVFSGQFFEGKWKIASNKDKIIFSWASFREKKNEEIELKSDKKYFLWAIVRKKNWKIALKNDKVISGGIFFWENEKNRFSKWQNNLFLGISHKDRENMEKSQKIFVRVIFWHKVRELYSKTARNLLEKRKSFFSHCRVIGVIHGAVGLRTGNEARFLPYNKS